MRKQRSSFDVCAVMRAQDQLSGLDQAKLHGYVVLWLATPDGTDRTFVRIDWTDGGFEVAEKNDPRLFVSFADSHPEAAADQTFSLGVLMGAAGMSFGAALVAAPSVGAVCVAEQLACAGSILL